MMQETIARREAVNDVLYGLRKSYVWRQIPDDLPESATHIPYLFLGV